MRDSPTSAMRAYILVAPVGVGLADGLWVCSVQLRLARQGPLHLEVQVPAGWWSGSGRCTGPAARDARANPRLTRSAPRPRRPSSRAPRRASSPSRACGHAGGHLACRVGGRVFRASPARARAPQAACNSRAPARVVTVHRSLAGRVLLAVAVLHLGRGGGAALRGAAAVGGGGGVLHGLRTMPTRAQALALVPGDQTPSPAPRRLPARARGRGRQCRYRA